MNKLNYQKAVDQITEMSSILDGVLLEDMNNKLQDFNELLAKSEYIKVPLVGVFSAGKSSLLNMFTEKPGMLPVDTEPETAVAYELYYSTTEQVELYREGALVDSKPLSEIKSLATKPGDVAKVYCNSQPIKGLQERGVILVDMPGIGSGIEKHDAAIANYINSGTAFVLIVDVEQGSLRASSLAFMQELSKYNMHPAVLVSKIDKKPEQEVRNVVEYIQYQLTKMGNVAPYVGTVCSVNHNLDGLNEYIASLDADKILAAKLNKSLQLIINSFIDQIKVKVKLRTSDVVNAEEKIKAVEEEIKNVKVEVNHENSGADTPEKSTQDILDNVRQALHAKSYDIAEMIVNREDKDAIKSVIVSTVRTEIIMSLKEESEQYSTAISSVIQESIGDLSVIEIDTNFMDDFSDLIDTFKDYIQNFLSFGGVWGQIVAVILPLLPDIIKKFFGKSNEEMAEEAREKLLTACEKGVIEGLRPTLYKITVENQKRIQKKLVEELVAKMESVKEGLRAKIEDSKKTKEEVEKEITILNANIDRLKVISAQFPG
ncbi:MAG: hypothetical protein HDR90_03620 [Bacteroides sp.]|nr:hypothetical protein [Bacteroides sp.]